MLVQTRKNRTQDLCLLIFSKSNRMTQGPGFLCVGMCVDGWLFVWGWGWMWESVCIKLFCEWWKICGNFWVFMPMFLCIYIYVNMYVRKYVRVCNSSILCFCVYVFMCIHVLLYIDIRKSVGRKKRGYRLPAISFHRDIPIYCTILSLINLHCTEINILQYIYISYSHVHTRTHKSMRRPLHSWLICKK